MQSGSAAWFALVRRQHDRDGCRTRNPDDRVRRPLAAHGRRRSTFPLHSQAALAPGVFRPVERADRTPRCGAVDQVREAPQPRGFLFRALDPMCARVPVPRRLRLEPGPCAPVGAELPGIVRAEAPLLALLVGVQSRLLAVPLLVDLVIPERAAEMTGLGSGVWSLGQPIRN